MIRFIDLSEKKMYIDKVQKCLPPNTIVASINAIKRTPSTTRRSRIIHSAIQSDSFRKIESFTKLDI